MRRTSACSCIHCCSQCSDFSTQQHSAQSVRVCFHFKVNMLRQTAVSLAWPCVQGVQVWRSRREREEVSCSSGHTSKWPLGPPPIMSYCQHTHTRTHFFSADFVGGAVDGSQVASTFCPSPSSPPHHRCFCPLLHIPYYYYYGAQVRNDQAMVVVDFWCSQTMSPVPSPEKGYCSSSFSPAACSFAGRRWTLLSSALLSSEEEEPIADSWY